MKINNIIAAWMPSLGLASSGPYLRSSGVMEASEAKPIQRRKALADDRFRIQFDNYPTIISLSIDINSFVCTGGTRCELKPDLPDTDVFEILLPGAASVLPHCIPVKEGYIETSQAIQSPFTDEIHFVGQTEGNTYHVSIDCYGGDIQSGQPRVLPATLSQNDLCHNFDWNNWRVCQVTHRDDLHGKKFGKIWPIPDKPEYVYSEHLKNYCVSSDTVEIHPNGQRVGELCATPDYCNPDRCDNGHCVPGFHSHHCFCLDDFSGDKCELSPGEIGGCANNPCQHGGSCVETDGSYECTCPAGFTGANCENLADDTNGGTDDGSSNGDSPGNDDGGNVSNTCNCENNGECISGICKCNSDFLGDHCQININMCSSNPCQNGGSCTNHINDYSCECAPGFQGRDCDTEIDKCEESPCQNDGTCRQGITNSFECTCPPGFEGNTCEIDVDECASAPCQNGGVCIDGINSYNCICPCGYEGDTCQENINDCASDSCKNGGTCNDGINEYSCDCPPGFSGPNCEVEDYCFSYSCGEHGTCTERRGPMCQCDEGFAGASCNIDEAEDLISLLFDAATRLIQKIEDEGSKKSLLFDNNKSNQAIIASLENMMKHLT